MSVLGITPLSEQTTTPALTPALGNQRSTFCGRKVEQIVSAALRSSVSLRLAERGSVQPAALQAIAIASATERAKAGLAGAASQAKNQKLRKELTKTSDTQISAPPGMTQVDALKRLWDCSYPASFFDSLPNGKVLAERQALEAWSSTTDIGALLTKQPYVDYFGGRCIKTDMATFPELNLAAYQSQCVPERSLEEIKHQCLGL